MLSCAAGFGRLYFAHGGAPPLDPDVRAVPVRRRSDGEALDPADRPAPPQAPAPLQRAPRPAGGGHGRHALAAPEGAGERRRRRAARDRRPAGPGRVPPHGEGPRAQPGDRQSRALGRAMDPVADRLFLEITRRYAPPPLAREDVAIALRLAQVEPGKPLADLGCGYGRHLHALVEEGYAHPIGIDRSRLLLREAARVLRPGGSLVLTTDNPLRLAATPRSRYEDTVPGLGRVEEESVWDQASSVDRVTRRLRPPGGEELSATFSIRYYAPAELAGLALGAGLALRRLEPDSPLTEDTPQLIALLEKVP